MKIEAEGKTYDVEEGITAARLWGKVRGCRGDDEAVLVETNGVVEDMRTPLTHPCTIKWIPFSSPRIIRSYRRTAILLLVSAVHSVYGSKRDVKIMHSLGNSLYCEFTDRHVPLQRELNLLENKMRDLIHEKLPIEQIEVGKKRAIAFLRKNHRMNDAAILSSMNVKQLHVYRYDSVTDYYFGPLLPDMKWIHHFSLTPYAPGFLFHLPVSQTDSQWEDREDPLFARVFLESQHWSERIGCHNLTELNRSIESGKIVDFIAIQEAFHSKKLAELADAVCSPELPVRLVCIAGPSSSGKTTFMRRLIIYLRADGVHPIMISLDNFFKNRDELKKEQINWENIEALDLDLFEQTISSLLGGKEVKIPYFNFKTGKKEWNDPPVKLGKNEPILVEGLHTLNPELTYFVPGYQVMRIYVSALTQLTINNHNRISTSDTRLLRRMVRDIQFRGYSPSHTLSIWQQVRKGEEANIFHFQNRADQIFNSALIYEIPVLKKLARPLLEKIDMDDPEYAEAQRLLEYLEPFKELDESYVPDHSLLREFIGYGHSKKTFISERANRI